MPDEPHDSTTPMSDAEWRLRAWVRDFGHTSQRPFVKDLEAVLNQLADLRTRTLTPPAASPSP